MARASRRQLVNVDENSLLRIAWIEGKHALVDIFLQAFALIARCQSAARRAGKQASLGPLGLGVSGPCDFLNDNAPLSIGIHRADRASVQDIAGADVSFTTDPVALLEGVAVVLGVVEVFLG